MSILGSVGNLSLLVLLIEKTRRKLPEPGQLTSAVLGPPDHLR